MDLKTQNSAVTNNLDLDKDKRYTYSDYIHWRFDEMVELIRGCIHRMSPGPARKHQEVSVVEI